MLPAEFLYSPAALEAVEAEERERERQAMLRKERLEAERKARAAGDPGGGGL